MKPTTLKLLAIGLLLIYCQISNAQYCVPFEIVEMDFQAETKFVKVDAQWYQSWIEYHNDSIVEPETGTRNEFRLYLNSAIDPEGDFFQPNDIVFFHG